VPAALVLVIANGFSALNFPLSNALYGLGRPKYVLFAQLAGLAVTGVALFLLLSQFGIMGAALASLFAYVSICASLALALAQALRTLKGVTASDS
jgi:O-antigen/teichoic acid export membrane protein